MNEPTGQPTPRYVTCRCQHCDGHIEFDAQNSGSSVACPHCGLETVLFVPQEAPILDKSKSVSLPTFRLLFRALRNTFRALFRALRKFWREREERKLEASKRYFPKAPSNAPPEPASKETETDPLLSLCSIALFLSGVALFGFGVSIFSAAEVRTVFQEYEAIFLGIGGLVIIALSLILAALIALIRKK